MTVAPEFQNTLDRAWRAQDYALARELIEDALLEAPGDAYLRVCLITALAHCSRFQSARDETSRLFARITRNERLQWSAELAAMWNDLGRHDLALPLAQRAMHSPHASARMVEIIADSLEHLRQLDEAWDVSCRGLRAYPGHPGISLVNARILRQRQQFDEAAEMLERLIASPRVPAAAKVGPGYELGHVHDAQGLYDQAFRAFSVAKQVQAGQARERLSMWAKHLDLLENRHNLPTRAAFVRSHDEARFQAVPGQRLAFLTGCPRSGTTLLERVLDCHDGVAATSETLTMKTEVWVPLSYELSTRSTAAIGVLEKLRALDSGQVRAARGKYWKLVPDALEADVDGRMVVDKNPSLFSSLPTIARLFSDAPILVALRDPRAIAWSCFTQHLSVNDESVAFLDLGTTCRHIAARLENWDTLRARLASPWREVRYEKLVGDLEGESRGILEFLGLPWSERVLRYHDQESLVRSPSYAQASRPIYTDAMGKWRNYEEHFDRHVPVLGPVMRELGYD